MTARDAHRRVMIVFEEHLSPGIITELDAWDLVYGIAPDTVIPVWSTKDELKKLMKIESALNEISNNYLGLHPRVARDFRRTVRRLPQLEYNEENWSPILPSEALTAFSILPALFEPAIATAREVAKAGADSPNKSDKIGASTVEIARRIWLRQEGSTAPPKELKDTSEIYDFLEAVFEALEIKRTVKSAYKAWGRLYTDE